MFPLKTYQVASYERNEGMKKRQPAVYTAASIHSSSRFSRRLHNACTHEGVQRSWIHRGPFQLPPFPTSAHKLFDHVARRILDGCYDAISCS